MSDHQYKGYLVENVQEKKTDKGKPYYTVTVKGKNGPWYLSTWEHDAMAIPVNGHVTLDFNAKQNGKFWNMEKGWVMNLPEPEAKDPTEQTPELQDTRVIDSKLRFLSNTIGAAIASGKITDPTHIGSWAIACATGADLMVEGKKPGWVDSQGVHHDNDSDVPF